jgi:NitT/TauT family transport system substrate-binding protein
MTWNIAARREFAEDHERIKKFLRAVIRANDIREHRRKHGHNSGKIGAKGALYEKNGRTIRFPRPGQSLILNLEDQSRWMIKREAGAVRETPNFMDFIFIEGLKAVSPKEVRISGK